MVSRWSKCVPVIIEPVGGGPRELAIITDHVGAAIVVARGYRFPHVDDVRRAAAELEEIDGRRDNAG